MSDIVSKPATEAYRNGWERCFGKPEREVPIPQPSWLPADRAYLVSVVEREDGEKRIDAAVVTNLGEVK